MDGTQAQAVSPCTQQQMDGTQAQAVSLCTQQQMDGTQAQAVLGQLTEQRSQGLFCDVTIVVEDIKFRAHANILAACSGYFRSAFTALDGGWPGSSSRVLELTDLKSEVFANILDFIYTSNVRSSASVDEHRCLVAAGKKLGIHFLERLADQERHSLVPPQTETVSSPIKTPDPSQDLVPKKTKTETHTDSSRGPRITNVFSITDVGQGNDPFGGERQSPDLGGHPCAGCPAHCSHTVDSEPKQALSEHSYSVSHGHKSPEPSQGGDTMPAEHSRSYTNRLAKCNSGRLKKQDKRRGSSIKSVRPASMNVTETPAVTDAPPLLYSEAKNRCMSMNLPLAIDRLGMELDPPTLLPHTEAAASISIYGCECCPEIFTNKTLLSVHMDICNREQACPKDMRGSPEQTPDDKQSNTDNTPDMNETVRDVSLPLPDMPDTTQPQRVLDRVAKPGAGRRVYKCSVCKRAYVTLSSLTRHENVHSWQRAYPCHYCNKVFALAEYRTKHEIWHTGERRYQCIFCLQTFMTYYVLKNHQKSVHGIDPRLSVNKNGKFKGNVYPIKLYRLLPMTFRKRSYKTYSQTYSEAVGSDLTPADCSPSEDSGAMNNTDSLLFPMSATFMATPKMVASVMPRISFDQPYDQGLDQSLGMVAEGGLRRDSEFASAATRKQDAPSNPQCSLISYAVSAQRANTQPGGESLVPLALDSEHEIHNMPFLDMMPQSSLNAVNGLSEWSAAERSVDVMTSRLLQSGPQSLVPSRAVGGKIETYIAKPVCPAPSVDGCALPLCQITMKIGDEAVICRRIKGSKLFHGKIKRSQPWSQAENAGLDRRAQGNVEGPSSSHRHHQRTEVQSSVIEPEPCDEPADCDVADQLWRPYYSYKPKKKSKKLRSRHGKKRRFSYSITPTTTAPVASKKNFKNTSHTNGDDSFSSGSLELTGCLRNSSPKATFTCNICSSNFITKSGLRAHVIGLHPSFCRICSKQCPPVSETSQANGECICESCLENGSCFDKTAQIPSSTEKRYRCAFCPQRFVYLATKRSHERKHQETNGNGYNSDIYPTQHKNTAILHEK